MASGESQSSAAPGAPQPQSLLAQVLAAALMLLAAGSDPQGHLHSFLFCTRELDRALFASRTLQAVGAGHAPKGQARGVWLSGLGMKEPMTGEKQCHHQLDKQTLIKFCV